MTYLAKVDGVEDLQEDIERSVNGRPADAAPSLSLPGLRPTVPIHSKLNMSCS